MPATKSDQDAHTENAGAEVVSRLARWGMALLGGAIVAIGIVMAPLPGPFGVPVMVVGLMILLRSSFWARRAFVKLQRRHPRIVFPLRRLLRREPEVMPVAWQQVLRFERMVLPKSWRFARRLRLSLRRKPKA
ncbi:MAG: PGPGW domain-containing protein [Caulobacteraceae bacterium]|nr:PGPGW domain-containing protein [Caulobacteraceae bacterium]